MIRFLITLATFLLPTILLAEEAAPVVGDVAGKVLQYKYMLYIVCVTIAASVGAMSQAKAAVVALESIARNPGAQDKIFVPMIISLALIESLVIITFVSVGLT